MRVQAGFGKPLGFQQITGLNTVKALTVPAGASWALIDAESQVVRWRDDGTDPTATVGKRLASGGEMLYDGDLAAIRFIEETASAKLNVTFYRHAR